MEVIIMALSNLFGWTKKNEEVVASACGSACGAGDKPEEKPAACGSACGAGDKPEEKPAACGSACGAGDK
jgi:ACGX-repeat protein